MVVKQSIKVATLLMLSGSIHAFPTLEVPRVNTNFLSCSSHQKTITVKKEVDKVTMIIEYLGYNQSYMIEGPKEFAERHRTIADISDSCMTAATWAALGKLAYNAWTSSSNLVDTPVLIAGSAAFIAYTLRNRSLAICDNVNTFIKREVPQQHLPKEADPGLRWFLIEKRKENPSQSFVTRTTRRTLADGSEVTESR